MLCLFFFFSIFGKETQQDLTDEPYYINMHICGRLGNQMFQVAAALSLAEDTGAMAIFPDFLNKNVDDRGRNLKSFFKFLNVEQPYVRMRYAFHEDPHFHYAPIEYHPNMVISGYFQSEKYFKHNKEKICSLFSPSAETVTYLTNKYSKVINHPNTVAIHLRAYKLEDHKIEQCFPFLNSDYYIKAADQFPENSLFVIFSDKINWAKKEMKNFTRPHIFIENETQYNDLYLMSFCKNQIISPSSFSWWAAYLNKNPDKIVIAPDPWFNPISGHDSSHIIPEGWRTLSWQ